MSDRINIEAIRSGYPLSRIAGASVKLTRCGKEWKGLCPFHEEASPSFTIFDGDRRFHCFGCAASGDVIDFVKHLNGVDFREAAGLICRGDIPTVDIPANTVNRKVDRTEEARSIWRAAQPADGTAAETYLRSRGIVSPIPETIRFARLQYGSRGREYPCLVAAVSDVSRHLIGIQRTYLREDGRGKASVPKAKLSLGRVCGGAIRLAAAAPGLIVCEGLEDGLTLQQANGRPVWVAAGASMLPAMRFPPNVRAVTIGGDNDDAGRAAVEKAVSAFQERSVVSQTMFPTEDKDFNAELMRRGHA